MHALVSRPVAERQNEPKKLAVTIIPAAEGSMAARAWSLDHA